MRLSISKEELQGRQKKFFKKLKENHIDGAVLFSVTDIFYLTGFHFHPTERPMGFIVDPQEKTHLFVPALEHEHAEEFAVIDFVHSYPEYPGVRHPMEYFKDVMHESGLQGKVIAYDSNGYGSPMGYRGPKLSDLLDAKDFVSVYGWVEEMRFIKSEAEIELIKESCRWGNLAHRLLAKYTKPGLSEIEITSRATTEATMMMVETLGPDYKPHGSPANAFFRGQIGEMAAFPHAVTQNIVFKKGDLFVTQAAADVWGYKSELERTMFVQEVTPEQEKYFTYMYNAQQLAFNTIKPGIPYSKVEETIQAYWKEEGIQHLTRHHTGHNIGLLGHEAPFFDLGDHTMIQPGMVVTVEPGLYVQGVGGFRHSDTVLITEDGIELLTYYPRDLESLITD
ncbi:Xaa-Pro aminopeptidase [Bacillus oleivorans]|uniref:Xaa-Pro aminopeptidase n=1 Tax=Bacillus oleivorans TaxID=1448271 RepID=A0A285CU94_9BACI|nr:Xaa-Pro peptidase family protein [Bacillus oleivorans]SNX70523.1 Xaa-Pro aminopeptidase [Bacillus oleivorans]